MAFTQGTRARLAVGNQADFRTIATMMRTLPINSHSLNLTKARVESGELRSDRQISVDRQGNRQIGGDITVEMRDGDFDMLLESAFFNAFTAVDDDGAGPGTTTTDTLRIGTEPRFLTIEDAMLDLDPVVYRRFTGCAVSSMNLSMTPNAMVLATFGIVGRDMTTEAAPVDASPVAPMSPEPWDTYTGHIEVDGANSVVLTAMDLTLNNNVAPVFVLGSPEAPQLEFGRGHVSGSLTAYFDSTDMYNRFVNETETALTVNLNDRRSSGTDTGYRLIMPRVKLNSGDVSVTDERSRTMTMEFMALLDDASGDTLRIEKHIT